ncbi:S53 family peptidase [Methylocapsa acidiphila]|uniref:S53 family peptidase n=1 Tax=Methylocapsa acidiphila TaxID=133552 RepID=UPI0003F52E23|nr:S53 family peptidase [Methylocapsa acidiphila]
MTQAIYFAAAAAFVAGFPAHAEPAANLMHGAQSIPARNAGSIVIPNSSLVQADDKGLRMHTNVRFFVSSSAHAQSPAAYGPPYSGLNFETPASLACIYGLVTATAGCNPNTVSAVPNGGSRAIAIVDAYHYPNALSDLAYFSSRFGLPAPTAANFQVVFAAGQQPAIDSGWELEMALDIEMAHATAPKAKIYLVEAASASLSDLLAAVDKAAQLVAAAGGGEVSMSWGGSEFNGQTAYDSHFSRSGVTFFASTGDSPGVQWPSSSANVVAVGGTSLSRQLGTMTFLHHASWADAGGGLSAYVARPAYQASVSGTVGSARGVPDIAAVADPSTGVWVYDSGNGGWLVVGGTSVAAPLVAGIVNASGHFYASSALELQAIYQNSAANAANFTAATTGYCGPQAAYTATTSWNLCLGVGSPKGFAYQ